MSMFDDFGKFGRDMDNRHKEFQRAAKDVPPGLKHEHIVPGAIVTMGPHKLIADRSYLDCVFEVLAFNGCHVALKQLFPAPNSDWDKRPRLIPLHEHDFYAGEAIYEAMRKCSDEEKKVKQ